MKDFLSSGQVIKHTNVTFHVKRLEIKLSCHHLSFVLLTVVRFWYINLFLYFCYFHYCSQVRLISYYQILNNKALERFIDYNHISPGPLHSFASFADFITTEGVSAIVGKKLSSFIYTAEVGCSSNKRSFEACELED